MKNNEFRKWVKENKSCTCSECLRDDERVWQAAEQATIKRVLEIVEQASSKYDLINDLKCEF